MQLLIPAASPSSSSSSSSSSTSSSSHSSGERHKCIEELERLHLRIHSPSPPPPPHLKGRKHRQHCPPPPHHHHHQHHHDHSVNKHGHPCPPPLCSLPCEKGQLRVKPPKPSKKVRKLHHKLVKDVPKGGGNQTHYHLPLGADALFEHPTGCCLHYSIERHPPGHEVGVGHHAHLRPVHPHPHKRHPCAKPQIRRGPVAPSHELRLPPLPC